jgi:hypothetical protein
MKTYYVRDKEVNIIYDDIFDRVRISYAANICMNITYTIRGNDFISMLKELDVLEVKDGVLLWDEYIEDDGETTRFNQHEITLHDYLYNYISPFEIDRIMYYIAFLDLENIFYHKQ